MLNKSELKNAVNTYSTQDATRQSFAEYIENDVLSDARNTKYNSLIINAVYDRYMNSPIRDANIAAGVLGLLTFVGGVACVIASGAVVPNIALATFVLLGGAAVVGLAGGLITYCASSVIRFDTLYNAVKHVYYFGDQHTVDQGAY